jgi:hypothetical protein
MGDNIKMDLQEVESEVMNWTDLALDRERRWALVNVVVMNTSVPHNAGNYRISWPIRRTFFPEKCDLNSNCVLYAEGK